MFDKLIGGKKRKETDLFSLPEKKYATDIKAISRMGPKALLELYQDQEKYISAFAQKIEQVRHEYDRLLEKNDELAEKNEVVNSQVSRMTNEHEELTIKFDNLQASLQIFSSENETLLRKEVEFLKENQTPTDKIKSIASLLTFYREKFSLCKKIQLQNKQLKCKLAGLEEELQESQAKIKAFQNDKNYNSMIPSLLKEIQDLKASSGKNNSQNREQDVQTLEQKIISKVKSELETASTVRSSEEEEQIAQKLAENQRIKSELAKDKKRANALQSQNDEYSTIIKKYEERIDTLEKQIVQLKLLNNNLQQEKQFQREKYAKLQQEYKQQSKQMQAQASQEAAAVLSELQDAREQIKSLDSLLRKTQSQLSQQKSTKDNLAEHNQKLSQQLSYKIAELERERSNRIAIENTLNSQNNSQIEHLLQIKNKTEKQLQETKISIDSEKKNVIQLQTKLKKIAEENEGLKTSLKRMNEEKTIIQENVSNCLKIAEEESQKNKAQMKQLKKNSEENKKENDTLKVKIKEVEQQLKNYSAETEKLFKTVQTKDHELRKAYAVNEQLDKEKAGLIQQLRERQEQQKSRARRYEAQLNQERIKLQSVNRKLTILQSKGQQNKTSMDGMYEQLLAKDKKISQMEIKLKEYKYKIQLLRKEKQQIENTYEHKLSNFHPEQESLKEIQNKEDQKNKSPKQQQAEEERKLLQNQLYSTKQENKVILAENQSLRNQIQDLKQEIADKEKNIKMLQDKRDNIMKEIEKMGKKNLQADPLSAMLPMLSPKEHSSGQNRQKKIASKALKGFDIVLKLQHQLYKNFVSVFAQQMEQEKIKGLENEINAVIKKSSDMRDVFEGYLQ